MRITEDDIPPPLLESSALNVQVSISLHTLPIHLHIQEAAGRQVSDLIVSGCSEL